jgi:hypothetical protein
MQRRRRGWAGARNGRAARVPPGRPPRPRVGLAMRSSRWPSGRCSGLVPRTSVSSLVATQRVRSGPGAGHASNARRVFSRRRGGTEHREPSRAQGAAMPALRSSVMGSSAPRAGPLLAAAQPATARPVRAEVVNPTAPRGTTAIAAPGTRPTARGSKHWSRRARAAPTPWRSRPPRKAGQTLSSRLEQRGRSSPLACWWGSGCGGCCGASSSAAPKGRRSAASACGARPRAEHVDAQ